MHIYYTFEKKTRKERLVNKKTQEVKTGVAGLNLHLIFEKLLMVVPIGLILYSATIIVSKMFIPESRQ